jgi:hypothetical protein
MTFRVSALLAAVAVFGLSELTPAFAQPVAPVRPRYSGFQSIFAPGVPPLVNPGGGFLGQQAIVGGLGGPLVPGFVFPGLGGAGGVGYPGALTLPQALPGAYGQPNPQLPPTGVVGSFGNYGHWYRLNGGNLGHWYPNGVANGRGALGYSGGGGGGFGGGGTGPGPRAPSAVNSALGTGLLAGATMNQFRR